MISKILAQYQETGNFFVRTKESVLRNINPSIWYWILNNFLKYEEGAVGIWFYRAWHKYLILNGY